MTSHKDHQLDLLGINSQYEADELEYELDVRFDRFSYLDREVWVQQNAYLDAHAHNGAVSDAANVAGVSIPTAQAWKYLNTLGFKRRLEIADLRFSDSIQVMALERAREPDAPASLLIALLRAHIPEKFSSNGHVCDTSKSDELLFHYRQDARRELEAGHPTFHAIMDGTYKPRHQRRNTQPHYYHNVSDESDTANDDPDTPTRHTREGGNPEAADPGPPSLPDDDIQPVDPDEVAYFNLPTTTGENTSSPSPVVGESLPRTRYGGWGEGEPLRPQNPAPGTQNPTRRPFATLFQKTRRNPDDDPNTFKVKRF